MACIGRMPLTTRQLSASCGLLALVLPLGCAAAPPIPVDTAARRAQLSLLMPSRIEIVEPFTRVKSFDDDAPDGIELLMQAVNSLDNPGLMIVGDVRIELYEHVPASGNRKGRRLEHWNIELSTVKHQRTHWNQLTHMYEFHLGLDPAAIPPADKYVLLVTYNSPLGEHLADEFVLEMPTTSLSRGR